MDASADSKPVTDLPDTAADIPGGLGVDGAAGTGGAMGGSSGNRDAGADTAGGGATGGTTTPSGDAAMDAGGQTGGTGGTDGAAGTGGSTVQTHCSNPDEFAAKAIAAGRAHTCALSTDGGVRCWGDNSSGQLGDGTTTDRSTSPTTDVLSGVQTIAVGGAHTCALMTTGGVRCWGSNWAGQLGDGTTTDRSAPPTTDVLSGVQAIAAGRYYTCALMKTGGVRCWGNNVSGQRGDGTSMDRSTPPTTDVLGGVQAIAVGYQHTCALMTTGGVRCWGSNSFGQLGDGNSSTVREAPPTADVLSGVQAIAAGGENTCALTTTGGVRCWGREVGDNGNRPPKSDEFSGVKAIAVGEEHACALMTTGGVRCWRMNTYGQLGDGTRTQHWPAPTSDVLGGVQAIAAGDLYSCALMTTGGVRCWGNNEYGQLGDGTTLNRATPPTSDVLTGAQAIAAGSHTCALMTPGGVRCWGDNTYGQLGQGTKTDRSTPDRLTPPPTDVLTGVRTIAAGSDHTCALMTTGGVRCWGRNRYGELGDGTTTDRATPPTSDVLTGVQAIAAGGGHTCALMTTGGVRCWGFGTYGALGDGTRTDRATPPTSDVLTGVQAIAAGANHTCALMTAGGVRCWGNNLSGQLGDGTTLNRTTPPVSDVLTGVQAIAAGFDYTCALMTTGGVRCWGDNQYAQLGDGTRTARATPPASDVLTGVQAIAAGYDHTCALMKTTGGVRCWGGNDHGQLGDGNAGFRVGPVPVVGTCGDAGPATGMLTLVGGKLGGPGDMDGIGPAARFRLPLAVAVDKAGSLFVADVDGHTIRRIDLATGAVTTLAGSAGLAGNADGMGSAARFNQPMGVASDGLGSLFVADQDNHTVRKIVVATGAVTTLAGSQGSSGSSDGIGTAARFYLPRALASDGLGNLFVADMLNHTIRKVVVATGAVTTLAGSAGNPGSADGTGETARFNTPWGVASDGAGNLFVADTGNNTIRKIEIATGVVTTLVGSPGSSGSVDGTGTAAWFSHPSGIASDGAGRLFVADQSVHTIRSVVVATRAVTTLAGSPAGDSGSSEGAGAAARFNNPTGVVSDGAGNLFVADLGNYVIRKVKIASREVSTFAGLTRPIGSTDGTGVDARFYIPRGVASDGQGNLFVADEGNHTIRKVVVATGAVTTLAGVAGVPGRADGTGADAQFNFPEGVALDGEGNLFVSDLEDHTIRKIVIATALVTTLAGSPGTSGSTDGIGSAARFSNPAGVASDGSGSLFVADSGSNTIRRVVISTGAVTTFAGSAGISGSTDGVGTAARFGALRGLASDGSGNLFVADSDNHTIRMIVIATGEVTTLAGLAGSSGSADGKGTAARFNWPWGIARDKAGDLFVADFDNGTIRKIVVATQEVTTVVGSPGRMGGILGPLPAGLSRPAGLAIGPSGELLITDGREDSILAVWF